MSNGALWATNTAPVRNSSRPGSTSSIGGAGATIASVMPVSTVMNGGIGRAGVDQGGELAHLLAAADLDRADLGDPVAVRRTAGGLQVQHHERDVAQGSAELGEAQLGVPVGHASQP